MFSIHDAKVQHSASPNSRNVMNRHELASYCELSHPQISTDIIIYWIITDFLFKHKDTKRLSLIVNEDTKSS